MRYRLCLLAIALSAIVGIGLTASLNPPSMWWWLGLEFVVLIVPFILLIRANLRLERELDELDASRIRRLSQGLLSRRAISRMQQRRAGRNRLN